MKRGKRIGAIRSGCDMAATGTISPIVAQSHSFGVRHSEAGVAAAALVWEKDAAGLDEARRIRGGLAEKP